ncbi:MAG: aminoglycoside phosphotransferase [Acidimicrobiia bacterium]|nr:aminoglycoside phosphotransferase [Acidimicrobiia bacterium]
MVGHPPPVLGSIAELTAGAVDRTAVHAPDGKSGASLERLTINGQACFLKSVSYNDDWLMRVTHDTRQWSALVWRAGLYHRCPEVIDHTVMAMALEGDGPSARLAFLMRDGGPDLIPEGDDMVDLTVHRCFIEHMAAMHARFWGWSDTLGLCQLSHRFNFFAPHNIASELRRPDVSPVLVVADQGWKQLPQRSRRLNEWVTAIHHRPQPLAEALATTPQTFIAGDWKMGNLGHHGDGRTILLDWAYPGEAPGGWDLGWYLALNRARLPEAKEATIAAYQAALEGQGVATAGWFEKQIDLCLLGMIACFGWEKALGDDDELAWWEDRAERALRWLPAGSI